jgi:type II secretory ATPase GspE/PulE/Tfp pilus assembly ATPase PilB-like protein
MQELLSDQNRRLCKKIGEMGIPKEQIDTLIANYRQKRGVMAFSQSIVEFGLATERQIAEWLADITGLGLASPADLAAAQPEVARRLSHSIAQLRGAVPLRFEKGKVLVAIHDPEAPQAGQIHHALKGMPHQFIIAPLGDILATIGVVYVNTARMSSDDSEWARFVEDIFREAANSGVSDIHFIPEENVTHVKFRMDGVLIAKRAVDKIDKERLASAVKLAAGRGDDGRVKIEGIGGLDVSQKLNPQDGSATRRYGAKRFSLRFSIIPAITGESIVVRLLDQDAQVGNLAALGMLPDHAACYQACVRLPDGLILNCGPTGHGKTTTLAAAVQYIDIHKKRVITVEDPIEYRLRGVTQIPAYPESKERTFAKILRALVRHNPNVLLLGEMRDTETANIGLSMSHTGHLLLTTTHANTALGGITRLLDLGVEASALAGSVKLLLGQRLVRRLCPSCRQPHPSGRELCQEHGGLLTAAVLGGLLKKEKVGFFEAGGGCARCAGADGQGSGYKGRIAIFELRLPTAHLRSTLTKQKEHFDLGAAEQEYTRARQGGNMMGRTMLEDGVIKAALGLTSLEEVFAATSVDI